MDKIPGANMGMKDLQTLTIGEITIACLDTPGHLDEHVSFVITHVTPKSTKIPFLFCGDTMFVGGCGKVFTGKYDVMFNSLHKLINLPYETPLYCAHEYTKSNLKFAKFVDPENPALFAKIAQVDDLLSKNLYTVGSPIGQEKDYNPFFTCLQS